jgi:hypothetical protein
MKTWFSSPARQVTGGSSPIALVTWMQLWRSRGASSTSVSSRFALRSVGRASWVLRAKLRRFWTIRTVRSVARRTTAEMPTRSSREVSRSSSLRSFSSSRRFASGSSRSAPRYASSTRRTSATTCSSGSALPATALRGLLISCATPGDQLADRREPLALNQRCLRLLQVGERLLERLRALGHLALEVGPLGLELADRAGETLAHPLDVAREASDLGRTRDLGHRGLELARRDDLGRLGDLDDRPRQLPGHARDHAADGDHQHHERADQGEHRPAAVGRLRPERPVEVHGREEHERRGEQQRISEVAQHALADRERRIGDAAVGLRLDAGDPPDDALDLRHRVAVPPALVVRDAPREQRRVADLDERVRALERAGTALEVEDARARAGHPQSKIYPREAPRQRAHRLDRGARLAPLAVAQGARDVAGEDQHGERVESGRSRREDGQELPPASEEVLALRAQERDPEQEHEVAAEDAGHRCALREATAKPGREQRAGVRAIRGRGQQLAPVDRPAHRRRHQRERERRDPQPRIGSLRQPRHRQGPGHEPRGARQQDLALAQDRREADSGRRSREGRREDQRWPRRAQGHRRHRRREQGDAERLPRGAQQLGAGPAAQHDAREREGHQGAQPISRAVARPTRSSSRLFGGLVWVGPTGRCRAMSST